VRKKNPAKKNSYLQDTILSVILVVKNDEDIIEERITAVCKELKQLKINYELLILDRASEDNTVKNIQSLHTYLKHIRIVVLSKQYETEIALTAGIDNCIGDYAVVFNIYTDPPEVLGKLLEKLLINYDIVMGDMKKEVIRYSFLSRLFLKTLQQLSRHHFEYRTNYLVALNRKAINAITRTRRKNRNFSYLNDFIGLKKTVIAYTPLKRYKYKLETENFFELFFTVTDIVISNSYRPIRIIAFLGILASGFFLMYVLIISLIYFFINRNIAPQGWISIAAVTGSLFFLLFSLLTLIAEYIIRTLHETRNEPLYFIADEIDKSVILTEQDKLNVV
jgi:dolichol-phosphate mannosyltransferase